MKPKILSLVALAQGLVATTSAALSVMGKPDQFEGENAKELGIAATALKENKETISKVLAGASELETLIDAEIAAAAAPLVETQIAARIAAGEFVKKADLDIAVGAAELRGKETAEAAASTAAAALAKVGARRTEITTAHGAEVAAALPESLLAVEEFAPVAAELGRRVTALSAIGVTAAAKPASFADIACSIPFDEAGKAAFDTRFAAAKELAGPTRTPAQIAAAQRGPLPGSGPVVIPGAPPVKPAATAAPETPYGF